MLEVGMKQSRIRYKQTMSLMLMQNSWKIIMQIQNGKKTSTQSMRILTAR